MNNVKLIINAEISAKRDPTKTLFATGESRQIAKRVDKEVMSNSNLKDAKEYPVGSFFQFTDGGISNLYVVRKQIPANVDLNPRNFNEYFMLISGYNEFKDAFPVK